MKTGLTPPLFIEMPVSSGYVFVCYGIDIAVMILIMLITAFLCLLSSINAYPDGAPAQVCDSMMSNHGIAAQTSTAYYQIFISPAYYSSGTTHTGKSII